MFNGHPQIPQYGAADPNQPRPVNPAGSNFQMFLPGYHVGFYPTPYHPIQPHIMPQPFLPPVAGQGTGSQGVPAQQANSPQPKQKRKYKKRTDAQHSVPTPVAERDPQLEKYWQEHCMFLHLKQQQEQQQQEQQAVFLNQMHPPPATNAIPIGFNQPTVEATRTVVPIPQAPPAPRLETPVQPVPAVQIPAVRTEAVYQPIGIELSPEELEMNELYDSFYRGEWEEEEEKEIAPRHNSILASLLIEKTSEHQPEELQNEIKSKAAEEEPEEQRQPTATEATVMADGEEDALEPIEAVLEVQHVPEEPQKTRNLRIKEEPLSPPPEQVDEIEPQNRNQPEEPKSAIAEPTTKTAGEEPEDQTLPTGTEETVMERGEEVAVESIETSFLDVQGPSEKPHKTQNFKIKKEALSPPPEQSVEIEPLKEAVGQQRLENEEIPVVRQTNATEEIQEDDDIQILYEKLPTLDTQQLRQFQERIGVLLGAREQPEAAPRNLKGVKMEPQEQEEEKQVGSMTTRRTEREGQPRGFDRRGVSFPNNVMLGDRHRAGRQQRRGGQRGLRKGDYECRRSKRASYRHGPY